jgi:hypothetical protein
VTYHKDRLSISPFIFKPVPEPSCAVLVFAGLAIIRRRRRI